MRWGKERRPRGTQVITLSTPYPTSSRKTIEVEWFFTYTRGWQKGPSEWLERFLRSWEESLPDMVKLKVSPVGSMPGTADRYDEMHTAHQGLAFASEAIGEGERVHRAMRAWLSNRVRRQRLHSARDVERFLRGLEVDLERYREPLPARRSRSACARPRKRLRPSQDMPRRSSATRTPHLVIRFFLSTGSTSSRVLSGAGSAPPCGSRTGCSARNCEPGDSRTVSANERGAMQAAQAGMPMLADGCCRSRSAGHRVAGAMGSWS